MTNSPVRHNNMVVEVDVDVDAVPDRELGSSHKTLIIIEFFIPFKFNP